MWWWGRCWCRGRWGTRSGARCFLQPATNLQVHNGLCDNRPGVLVVPRVERDVVEAVVWARRWGEEVR